MKLTDLDSGKCDWRDPYGYVPAPDPMPTAPVKAAAALRQLGCVCERPLQGPFDPACPIVGHGQPLTGGAS